MLTKNYPKKQIFKALCSLSVLFLFMGMLTSLNDLLIPKMKQIFNLNYKQSLIIQVVWFSSFVVCSYPFGSMIRKRSYKFGMIAGYLLSALGTASFILSWWVNIYLAFLLSLSTLACGVCFLQVVSNPFAISLGSPNKAGQRMAIFHSFFAVGTTIAPILVSMLQASDISDNLFSLVKKFSSADNQQQSIKIVTTYSMFFIFVVIMAIITYMQNLPDLLADEKKQKQNTCLPNKSAWSYPHTILGAVSIFFCVGGETLAASFIVNFTKVTCPNITENTSGLFVSFFWAGILIGRLSAPVLFKIWNQSNILLFCTLVSAFLLLVPLMTTGITAVIAVALVGLFNSVMYPIIYSSAMKSLPPSTATQASSIVSTNIIGGAIIPMLGAFVADTFGIAVAFSVGSVCFIIIAAYPIYLNLCEKIKL